MSMREFKALGQRKLLEELVAAGRIDPLMADVLRCMIDCGLTNIELCRRAGVDAHTVLNIWNGHVASIPTVKKLLHAMNCELKIVRKDEQKADEGASGTPSEDQYSGGSRADRSNTQGCGTDGVGSR